MNKKHDQWSRVKSKQQFNAQRIVVFDMEDDLKKFFKDPAFTTPCKPEDSNFLFDPDDYHKDQNGFDTGDYNLTE